MFLQAWIQEQQEAGLGIKTRASNGLVQLIKCSVLSSLAAGRSPGTERLLAQLLQSPSAAYHQEQMPSPPPLPGTTGYRGVLGVGCQL